MNTRRRAVAVTAVAAAAALILGVAASEAGQSRYAVKIAFADGRVSLVAEEAPASDVLAEWSRVGKTEVIGAELVEKRVITVRLEDVAEAEALEAILGKAYGFVEMAKSVEPGLSGIRRLVIGESRGPRDEKVDSSTPPEARYSYYVGEKILAAGDFGTPEYKVLDTPPQSPETLFGYYTPEKALSEFGTPVYEPLDRRWVIPEVRFEYFSKDFGKFVADDTPVRIPTAYPEVRFTYFVGPKAVPK